MGDVYQVGRAGTLKDRHEFGQLDKALEVLGKRLGELPAPYQIRRPNEDFSAGRSMEKTLRRVEELLIQHDGGLRLAVRSADHTKAPIAVRRTLEMGGPEVLQEAIHYIGVPYDFGEMNALGPEGGAGAEVDCSGLVCLCYEAVDVHLPHNAERIRNDPQIELYHEAAKVQPGDIVLYHTGSQNLPEGQADHCAILVDQDTQIAAPGTGRFVERESVNQSALLAFAFVEAVTGSH